MRRVLLVSDRSVPGGAQRAFATLAERLPEAGWAPAAAVGERGPFVDWLREAGVPVQLAETPEDVMAAAVEHRADVVLSLCAKGHLLGGPAAARLGLPAVWWRMLTPRGRPYEAAAAEIPAAAVATLSHAAAAVQRRLSPGVPVEAIAAGIDVAAARAWRGSGRALRERLGGPLVGIVGRIDPAKGQDDFLRAAALLDPSLRFAVVGGAVVGHEGDLPERLRALASELGIADRVTFTGHVEDPLRWFDALDIAVVASHHEAFGLVCVEALALGVPVVATATDGPSEILQGGALVPPRDPPALAEAIARALREPPPVDPERVWEYDAALTARRMAALLERVSGASSAAGGSAAAHAVPAAPA